MLTPEEIKQRIINLEGQQTEFKLTPEEKGATDSVKKSLVAFSNDYHQLGGGVIFFGVDDHSQEIKGVETPDSLDTPFNGYL